MTGVSLGTIPVLGSIMTGLVNMVTKCASQSASSVNACLRLLSGCVILPRCQCREVDFRFQAADYAFPPMIVLLWTSLDENYLLGEVVIEIHDKLEVHTPFVPKVRAEEGQILIFPLVYPYRPTKKPRGYVMVILVVYSRDNNWSGRPGNCGP